MGIEPGDITVESLVDQYCTSENCDAPPGAPRVATHKVMCDFRGLGLKVRVRGPLCLRCAEALRDWARAEVAG